MKKMALYLILYLVAGAAAAQEHERFWQGPGTIGEWATVRGMVVGPAPGLKTDCYLMMAGPLNSDLPTGAGRFFLCGMRQDMRAGQAWSGKVQQVDRQRARVGTVWRTLPVLERVR